jgi:23S rRNA (cytidine1920-2'-O)/16S rRNA (cytidine1409-2'-O)-methyltransferase
MKIEKERIDLLLVEKGFYPTREKARAAIMAGLVLLGDEKILKPGEKVPRSGEIRIKGSAIPFVSRGGVKLAHALDVFQLSVNGRTMMDIGSSTGGFTDCALQRGVIKSYCIDVGTNQLAWELRQDPRVVSMEKTNFRNVTPEVIPDAIDFVSIDVSFISLQQILVPLLPFCQTTTDVIALVKPQFEAGRESIGKGGIVRDAQVHERVLLEVMDASHQKGFQSWDVTYSPVTGGDGNIEFFLYLRRIFPGDEDKTSELKQRIPQLVQEAHERFSRK